MSARFSLEDLPLLYRDQAREKLGKNTVDTFKRSQRLRRSRVGDLLLQLAVMGLPAPETEVRFHPERRWRFDLSWRDRMLAVEVEGLTYDGGRHQRPDGFEKDIEKYQAAQELGWTVIRVTPRQIKMGKALRTIERAFGSTTNTKQCKETA